ncbi:MAG: PAS domain-containing protein [Chloracidobacterium sp.]|nr:PAS domain-containing protein [Chloracidobacterium sp.]
MRKREIKAIVESTADPAFAVNGMHNIEFWNSAAESFLVFNQTRLLGGVVVRSSPDMMSAASFVRTTVRS